MQSKVQAPAIALLVTAGLAFLLLVASLFLGDAFLEFAESRGELDAEQLEQMRMALQPGAMGVAMNVLAFAGCLLVAFGAWKMLKLESYGLAITASILAMIPCFTSCCCLIGLPVGIWSLIVLFDKDVKAAFAGQSSSTPPPL
jgi:hypothetical protein